MTDTLAEVLADIDDPKTLQQIIAGSGLGEAAPLSQDEYQPTLTVLYERYLNRRQNRSQATVAQYKRTIPNFIEFANRGDATYPADLSMELIDQYVDHLQSKYNADSTILTYTKNVRAWLQWLHKRGRCEKSIYLLLDRDELGLSPKARDEALPQAQAESLLSKLRNQRYGTAEHALFELLWNSGLRIGEVRALDQSDFDPSENDLAIRHRPTTGTRIKNGNADDQIEGDGERNILLHPRVTEALTTYIQTHRNDVTDQYGREPLFTTQGRPARSTLRRWIYSVTSCRWIEEPPEGNRCDGSCDPDSDVCSHSYYPHAIRRGAIVSYLSNGLRPDRAAGRFDVSTQTIEKHYDPRSKSRRKNDRADAVRSAWDS